jgi:SAM-dependent methyltransferase
MRRLDALRLLSGGLISRVAKARPSDARPGSAPPHAPSGIPKVLYVNHPDRSCGVHQFGKSIGATIASSRRFAITYLECLGPSELNDAIVREAPSCIIYNYHPSTLAWAKWNAFAVRVPQIAVIHEVHQNVADEAGRDDLFDYYIAADPTLLLKNPLVFKTGRLVPPCGASREWPAPRIPTIGSFGFGTPGKGFDRIVRQVQQEFDEAIIRFNIPSATFGDADGSAAKNIAADCRALISKPGIELEVTHEFLDDDALLDFLAQNTLNAFMYEQAEARGISSVVDYALAVDRPLAVSDSGMFRHVHAAAPSTIVPKASFKEIIARGTAPLEALKKEYTAENLVWDYERVIGEVLRKGPARTVTKKLLHFGLRKTGLKRSKTTHASWASHDDNHAAIIELLPRGSFEDLPGEVVTRFNRILDDSARETYKPIIEQMWRIVPGIMQKKIPEANVQQAFVLDTALKFARAFPSPRFLAVGSYEDTAVAVLKALGHDVTDVDPVLNYDLHTYATKPSAIGEQFDIVVSTSVIEHVADDVTFCRDIASRLKPGGIAILTCDYNDDYKPGDDIPDVDCRFYTQKDIVQRLMKAVSDCVLYDDPSWDCPNPDFVYLGRYVYTFATIVFRKLP